MLAQDSWKVEGGVRLRGTLRPAGSKNASLPELAACLLTDRPVRLEGLPAIRDVRSMLNLLASLGVEIDDQPDAVTLTASRVDPSRLDFASARAIRASILLAGPLPARCGRLELPPGGDVTAGGVWIHTSYRSKPSERSSITLEAPIVSRGLRSPEPRCFWTSLRSPRRRTS